MRAKGLVSVVVSMVGIAAGILGLAMTTGCQGPKPNWNAAEHSAIDRTVRVRDGDLVQFSFPGAPNLNFDQQVRRDGKISLPMLVEPTEIQVSGLKPAEVEAEVLRYYDPQLRVKQVDLRLNPKPLEVYVSGAVLQPGKIAVDREITALEAIMEAGGAIGSAAKLDRVIVIRHQGGEVQQFLLNIEDVFEGRPSKPFYLQANDIVHVPEKKTSLL